MMVSPVETGRAGFRKELFCTNWVWDASILDVQQTGGWWVSNHQLTVQERVRLARRSISTEKGTGLRKEVTLNLV